MFLIFKLSYILQCSQCLQAADACDDVTADNIAKMVMISKVSTKPLVVIQGPGLFESRTQNISHPLTAAHVLVDS